MYPKKITTTRKKVFLTNLHKRTCHQKDLLSIQSQIQQINCQRTTGRVSSPNYAKRLAISLCRNNLKKWTKKVEVLSSISHQGGKHPQIEVIGSNITWSGQQPQFEVLSSMSHQGGQYPQIGVIGSNITWSGQQPQLKVLSSMSHQGGQHPQIGVISLNIKWSGQ